MLALGNCKKWILDWTHDWTIWNEIWTEIWTGTGQSFCTISVSEAVVLSTSDLGQGMHKICMYKCLWV